MSSSLILAGLGMAAVGFGGRYLARTMPHMARRAEEVNIYFLTKILRQCDVLCLGLQQDGDAFDRLGVLGQL